MSLAPKASTDLGNFRYEAQMPLVVATLGLLPGVSAFSVTLPVGARLEAGPGDPAVLRLDGGEGEETVLTGRVRSVLRALPSVTVQAADGSADLAAFRPAVTYERQGAREVIRGLASDAGVSLGQVEADLDLAAYVAHQRRTAGEHVAQMALLSGAIAFTDGNGRLNVVPRPAVPEAALRYGREILEYRVTEQSEPVGQRIAVGSGPAGTAEAPEALQQGTDPLPASAPSPGADAVWEPFPLLRTPRAATAASQALQVASRAEATRLTARGFLLPAMRPGLVVEVQDLPEGRSGGPWLLIRVTHRLDPRRGGLTTLEGVSAGSGGSGGLLRAALATAGSLL
jgi:hypothetical protein